MGIGLKNNHDHYHTVCPETPTLRQLGTNLGKQRVTIPVTHCSSTLDVAGSKKKRKWKWLFVSGCEGKIPICTETEYLNTFQDGRNLT
jgi:hypothetical protein